MQKAPAATIEVLAHALVQLLGVPDYLINIIGTRHGEKQFEALLSREERVHAIEMAELGKVVKSNGGAITAGTGYFKVPPDNRDLNYGKFVEQGEKQLSVAEDYNSHNTARLSVDEMKTLLLKLMPMQRIVAALQLGEPLAQALAAHGSFGD